MNNFTTTAYYEQPTNLDAIYKILFDEVSCMVQHKANVEATKASTKQSLKIALVSSYKAAKALVVTKKSIFTNNVLSFTVEQLLQVKGIGLVKAKAIMDFIKAYAVTSIEQLAHVKGVGKVLLDTLMNHKF